MISGANEEQLDIANDRADLLLEIDKLNNDIKELLKENENKEKVIIKQDNIINELEKSLKEEYDYCDKHLDPAFGTGMGVATRMLNKLKELKGE